MARRHIVLVGLPGSGKTTIGRLVAEDLGAAFADVDLLVEQRTGRTVSALFADRGEAAFRALEAAIAAELLAGPAGVLAPGAGFFVDPESRRRALQVGWVLYLVTSPAVAAGRLAGASDRPLLRGGDPERRLAELLARREAAYLEAQERVMTDGRSPSDVAREVVALARSHAGW